jgi:(2Fe-2S) ferredoxin
MKTGKTVTVCVNYRVNPDAPSCGARGGVEIAAALEAAIAERGLPVAVERFNCLGQCNFGPNLKLSPGGEFCQGVRLEDLPQLLEKITAFAKD